MNKRKWTNEQFILAVETSLSYAEVIMIQLREKLKNQILIFLT